MYFETLLSPINIGSCTIKNRFVVPPMDTSFPNDDGTVSQQAIDYYAERAKGGFGLITIEYVSVDPNGKPMPNTFSIYDDKFIPGFKKLAEAIHQYHGAKTFLQLNHCGRQGYPTITGIELEAPSAISCGSLRHIPREMTTQDVYDMVEQFGDGAYRAMLAGFDGVEIHGGHGYLVGEFMSFYANKRLDEFGGNFRDRMRFPELIIQNIRRKCGNDFPISMRISADERVPGCPDINETRAIAKYLEGVGLDAMNVSTAGYASAHMCFPSSQINYEFNIAAAEAVKASTSKLVVIGGGRVPEPYLAEDILTSNRADMVFFGRGSIADPHLPNKVAAGKYEEICPCIGCVERCPQHFHNHDTFLSCLMNPVTGREGTLKMEKTQQPKNIAVVGGGPGGLYTAWVSAKRGHKVTLFEKQGVMGGQFRIGSLPPFKHDVARGIKYMVTMCRKYGVDIRMNTEASADMLTGYDCVVLATGGTPLVPNIPGINGENIYKAVDIFTGNLPNKLMPRGKMLVIGGGIVGLEIADFMGERDNKITVVEMADTVGAAYDFRVTRIMMPRLLNDYGVEIRTGTKVKEFTADGAICQCKGEELVLSGYDAIILAMGAKSYNPLQAELEGKVPELHVIGDARKPAMALDAIEEAVFLANEL